jgi:mono/diheme cytochrome c family protein
MNIDDLVRLAAEALKMPESMVRQSAEARSKAAGRTVEVILGEWAGVDPSADAPPRPETPDAPSPAEAPTEPAPAAEAPAEPAPPAEPAAAAPAIDAADLLARAAAAQGLPEAMTKRSAAARAKAEGQTVDEVLAEWAGVELSAAPASEEPAAPAEPAESAPAPAPAAEAPAAAVDAADLLAKAAAAQGLPEGMTKRSAAARAKAEGKTPEQVLAEWAGVEAPAATAEAAPVASSEAAPAATPAESPAAPAAQIEVIAEESEDAPVEPAPVRELVTPSGALPRWLAALFVAVPLFAVTYASFLPNGPNCGDAGSLAVDPVTGIAVNCDGSEFGKEEVDFFAIGAEVYGASCAVCHGPTGGGIASFPPFIDGALLATFPDGSCDQHVEWVNLGSSGWPDATYGANNKPVGGSGAVMPGFGTQLSEQELRSVAIYERVQFGGVTLEGAIADCGLEVEEG